MKTKHLFKIQLAAALLFAAINSQLSTAHAQTAFPPTASPHGIISYTITQPGSYYLTRNLTVSSGNCITIATNCVTLDLHGFTISSTAPSATGTGILLNGGNRGLRNITILNGFIQSGVVNNGGIYSGSGFVNGISHSGELGSFNTRVCGVSVWGVLNNGISLGRATVVEDCTVTTAGGCGIAASTIKDSVANDCGQDAISGSQVDDCQGISSGAGNGVSATTAQNCYGTSSSGYGVNAYVALNCYGISTSSYGINATTAQNCCGTSSSGTGVSVATAQNCYGNSSSSNGVSATTAQNCSGNSSNGDGVDANTALNCYGNSSGTPAAITYGVNATTVLNCYGTSSSTYATSYTFGSIYYNASAGIYASTAQNCYGQGNRLGLYADIANSCYGHSGNGYTGLWAIYMANSCYGDGEGIFASDANFCFGSYLDIVNHKYNMP